MGETKAARATRLQVLGALAIGCAAGWLLHGAAGCGTAKAAELEEREVTCDKSGTLDGQAVTFGVLELPGRTAEDILLTVYRPVDTPSTTTLGGVTWQKSSSAPQPISHAADGKALVTCGPGQSGKVVRVLVR